MSSQFEIDVLSILSQLKEDQGDRHAENTGRLQRLESMFNDAFPDGDAASHRRYHEALIRKAEERTKFWYELRVKLAEKGMWAMIVFCACALYWYAKEGPKQ